MISILDMQCLTFKAVAYATWSTHACEVLNFFSSRLQLPFRLLFLPSMRGVRYYGFLLCEFARVPAWYMCKIFAACARCYSIEPLKAPPTIVV